MRPCKFLVSAVLLVITGACLTVEKQGLIDWQNPVTWTVGTSAGGGGLWLLANFAYLGMRAQGNQDSPGWRLLAFIFGFPGSLLSCIVVVEGSERAYGVDLPRRARQSRAQSIPAGEQKPGSPLSA